MQDLLSLKLLIRLIRMDENEWNQFLQLLTDLRKAYHG